MPALKTSLLLIGSWPAAMKEMGAVISTDLGEAVSSLQDSSFNVVAMTVTALLEKRFPDFLQRLRDGNPAAQIILIAPSEYDSSQLVRLFTQYPIHRVLDSFTDPRLEEAIYSAAEKAQQQKQNQNLEALIQDQNQTLLRLQQELEQRIEKRARSLSESRHRLRVLNTRTEALRRSMLAVYRASSLPEMEQFLNQSLASVAECSWIKIVTYPQDFNFQEQLKQMGSFSQLQIPLFKQQERIGSLFFMRPPDQSFTRDETDFLGRVAEAVALAVVRIQKLNDSQTVKEQWETTFDSMSQPVALISQDYDLVQTNATFRRLAKNPEGKKCYQVLFARTQPCPGCQLGERYQIENEDADKKTYEVYSQAVRLEADRKNSYFNIYHDITDKLRIEKQILDSAKRAELGTIGSSIAHELNNPLGGILTFTQILKSETAKEESLYEELVALEQGALRCKEIIQNLLEFSRRSKVNEIGQVPLQEILQQVFKLMEIRTKPLGIETQLISKNQDIVIEGERSRLSQVFTHILQQQIQNVLDAKAGSTGKIKWKISTDKEKVYFEAYDSSTLPLWDQNVSSFSYSLVGQVLRDFAASLEIPAPSSPEWKAKISFSRPVLHNN